MDLSNFIEEDIQQCVKMSILWGSVESELVAYGNTNPSERSDKYHSITKRYVDRWNFSDKNLDQMKKIYDDFSTTAERTMHKLKDYWNVPKLDEILKIAEEFHFYSRKETKEAFIHRVMCQIRSKIEPRVLKMEENSNAFYDNQFKADANEITYSQYKVKAKTLSNDPYYFHVKIRGLEYIPYLVPESRYQEQRTYFENDICGGFERTCTVTVKVQKNELSSYFKANSPHNKLHITTEGHIVLSNAPESVAQVHFKRV